MQRIGFYLMDGFAMMSTAAAMEPLRAANLFSTRPRYEIVPLSAQGGAVGASLPAAFETRAIRDAGSDFDMVFVVAGGDPFARRDPAAEDWLRALARRGVVLGGISGGAAVLAMAGLLENRRFTLHWHHFEALRARLPGLALEQRLYVIDRDRATCAGGTAPLDMMQAMIATAHGTPFARRIADWFIQTEIRVAHSPQQASLSARYGALPRSVLEALELMESHIADPLDLAQLAGLVGLSERQLQRQFRASLGQSVMQRYREMRLHIARDLLQTTSYSISEIAFMAGFPAQSGFSAAYRRAFQHSPRALRQTSAQRPGQP